MPLKYSAPPQKIKSTVPNRTHSYRHTTLSEILNRIVGKIILLHIQGSKVTGARLPGAT